jgi:hypothetical protein
MITPGGNPPFTSVVETDASILPQWKGRPVPWVTRWTGQIVNESLMVSVDTDGDVWARYRGGDENREQSGILWMKEGLNRNGEPEFSQMSAYRQRASMAKRLCQVCGQKINDRPIRWLLSKYQMDHTPEGEILTISPPTCERCIPLAMRLCPHLKDRDHAAVATVLKYEIWGVYGSVVYVDQQLRSQEKRGVLVPYDRDDLPFPYQSVIARQLVARWTKFILEDM